MKVDDCYQLGYISKSHGLKGEVQFFMDVDDAYQYSELESVFVEQNGNLIPFFIDTILIRPKQCIVKLEDIDTLEETEKLIGARLFLPEKFLPKLKGDQYYYHELIGAQVEDLELGTLGKVVNVVEVPGQNLLIMEYKEVEVLIPITDEVMLSFDREKMLIKTQLPEGLLDIYLEG